jgi:hypothetical protein
VDLAYIEEDVRGRLPHLTIEVVGDPDESSFDPFPRAKKEGSE